ncbi:MAG: hypothetical protein ACPGSB_02835 [Opitutales bacterium]
MNTQIITALVIGTLFLVACEEEETSKTPESKSSLTGNSITLATVIPPEHIEGTPQPVKVPNLEKVASNAPVLVVPEGTTLLSAGKPVTASDDFPITGELNYITDTDKEAGEGYFVELMDGLQWVQIDLANNAKLSAVWLWHYHLEARAYHDVIVQLSNDPDFEEGVTTIFNNDYDNSANFGKGKDRPYVDTRFGKLINANGIEARYVRLYSNGNTSNDMNHYIEVEVFGIEK